MNVLIAVDHSEASAKAVQFAGRLFSGRSSESLNITLFHVVESLPDFLLSRAQDGESAEVYGRIVSEWELDNRRRGDELVAAHQATLTQAGVPQSSLHVKLTIRESRPEARRVMAAQAIIEEMTNENYDTVIVGRRGASSAMGSLLGSVAIKVAREATGRSIIIVD